MQYIEDFKKHCLDAYPQEAVGVILNNEYIPLENIAEDPLNYFEVKKEDVIKYLDMDIKLLHSHTMQSFKYDPRTPSKLDMQCQQDLDIPFGIVHCDGENISEILWIGVEDNTPLIGRPYIANKYDCFTLIADYFKSRGIIVNSIPRNREWEDESPHLLELNYKDAGFRDVDISEAQPGDVLMLSIGSRYINHLGLITSDATFIHHLYDRNSSEDRIDKWKRQIRRIVRHKDL